MNDWQYLAWFIAMAVAAAAASLGGVTLTYFLDKRRVDPPVATPIRKMADEPERRPADDAPRMTHQAA